MFSVLKNISSEWNIAYKWEGAQAATFQEDVVLHHAGRSTDASPYRP